MIDLSIAVGWQKVYCRFQARIEDQLGFEKSNPPHPYCVILFYSRYQAVGQEIVEGLWLGSRHEARLHEALHVRGRVRGRAAGRGRVGTVLFGIRH